MRAVLNSGLVHFVLEALDFFFKSEFSLLQGGDHQIVWMRAVQFLLNLLVQLVVLIREFLDMRVQAPVQ